MPSETKNPLEKANISLLLDGYDSLFSDFDPRPYTERAISDDFLAEIKKATRENETGDLELRFLLPKHVHNPHEDPVVRERLHHHFKKHAGFLESQTRSLLKNGTLLAALGIGLMFLASLIAHYGTGTFFYDLLKVVFEPAGWFMVWFGLDQIFYLERQKKAELDFYRKLSKAEIHFEVY